MYKSAVLFSIISIVFWNCSNRSHHNGESVLNKNDSVQIPDCIDKYHGLEWGSIISLTSSDDLSIAIIQDVKSKGIKLAKYPEIQNCTSDDGKYMFELIYNDNLELICINKHMECDSSLNEIIKENLLLLKVKKMNQDSSGIYKLIVNINPNLNIISYSNPYNILNKKNQAN